MEFRTTSTNTFVTKHGHKLDRIIVGLAEIEASLLEEPHAEDKGKGLQRFVGFELLKLSETGHRSLKEFFHLRKNHMVLHKDFRLS